MPLPTVRINSWLHKIWRLAQLPIFWVMVSLTTGLSYASVIFFASYLYATYVLSLWPLSKIEEILGRFLPIFRLPDLSV